MPPKLNIRGNSYISHYDNFINPVIIIICKISTESIIINEVNQAGQWVELYNASTTATTNVANWQLCNFPTYDVFTGNADITILSGNTMMTPGSYLVLSWPKGIDPMKTDGELALYVDGSFGSATSMRDYMQYGSGNHQGRSKPGH